MAEQTETILFALELENRFQSALDALNAGLANINSIVRQTSSSMGDGFKDGSSQATTALGQITTSATNLTASLLPVNTAILDISKSSLEAAASAKSITDSLEGVQNSTSEASSRVNEFSSSIRDASSSASELEAAFGSISNASSSLTGSLSSIDSVANDIGDSINNLDVSMMDKLSESSRRAEDASIALGTSEKIQKTYSDELSKAKKDLGNSTDKSAQQTDRFKVVTDAAKGAVNEASATAKAAASAYTGLTTAIIGVDSNAASLHGIFSKITGSLKDVVTETKSLSTGLLAITGVGVAVIGTIAGLGSQAVESMNNMKDLVNMTGMTRSELGQLSTTLKLTGTSAESLPRLFFIFGNTMSTATAAMADGTYKTNNQYQAFEKLGVALVDSEGKLRGEGDVLKDSMKALGEMTSETERSSTARALFGKTAFQILPALKEYNELQERAAELNKKYSVSAVDPVKYTKEFNDITTELGKAFGMVAASAAPLFLEIMEKARDLGTGLAEKLSKGLLMLTVLWDEFKANVLPKIEEFVASAIQTLQPIAEFLFSALVSGLGALSNVISFVIDVVSGLIGALATLYDWLVNTSEGNTVLLVAVVTLGTAIMSVMVPAAFAAISAAVGMIAAWVAAAAPFILIGGLIAGLMVIFPELRDIVIEVMSRAAAGVAGAVGIMIQWFSRLVSAVIDAAGWIAKAFAWISSAGGLLKNNISNTLEGIGKGLEGAAAQVRSWGDGAEQGFSKFGDGIIKAGAGLRDNINNGTLLQGVMGGVGSMFGSTGGKGFDLGSIFSGLGDKADALRNSFKGVGGAAETAGNQFEGMGNKAKGGAGAAANALDQLKKSLQDQIKEQEKEKSQLEKQLKGYEDQQKAVDAYNKKVKELSDTLKSQLAPTMKLVTDELMAGGGGSAVSALLGMADSLDANATSLTDIFIPGLEDSIKSTKDQIKSIEDSIQALKDQIDQLEQAKNALADQVAANETATESNKVLASSYTAVAKEATAAKDAVMSLVDELESAGWGGGGGPAPESPERPVYYGPVLPYTGKKGMFDRGDKAGASGGGKDTPKEDSAPQEPPPPPIPLPPTPNLGPSSTVWPTRLQSLGDSKFLDEATSANSSYYQSLKLVNPTMLDQSTAADVINSAFDAMRSKLLDVATYTSDLATEISESIPPTEDIADSFDDVGKAAEDTVQPISNFTKGINESSKQLKDLPKGLEDAQSKANDVQAALAKYRENIFIPWRNALDEINKSQFNMGTSASVAASGLNLAAKAVEANTKAGTDYKVPLDTAVTLVGILDDKVGSLSDAQQKAVRPTLDAAKALLEMAKNGGLSDDAVAALMQKLRDELLPVLDNAAKIVDAQSKAIAASLKTNMQIEGVTALQALNKSFDDVARNNWLDTLNVSIQNNITQLAALRNAGKGATDEAKALELQITNAATAAKNAMDTVALAEENRRNAAKQAKDAAEVHLKEQQDAAKIVGDIWAKTQSVIASGWSAAFSINPEAIRQQAEANARMIEQLAKERDQTTSDQKAIHNANLAYFKELNKIWDTSVTSIKDWNATSGVMSVADRSAKDLMDRAQSVMAAVERGDAVPDWAKSLIKTYTAPDKVSTTISRTVVDALGRAVDASQFDRIGVTADEESGQLFLSQAAQEAGYSLRDVVTEQRYKGKTTSSVGLSDLISTLLQGGGYSGAQASYLWGMTAGKSDEGMSGADLPAWLQALTGQKRSLIETIGQYQSEMDMSNYYKQMADKINETGLVGTIFDPNYLPITNQQQAVYAELRRQGYTDEQIGQYLQKAGFKDPSKVTPILRTVQTPYPTTNFDAMAPVTPMLRYGPDSTQFISPAFAPPGTGFADQATSEEIQAAADALYASLKASGRAFDNGGPVTETGLAMVHSGEYVIPVGGSLVGGGGGGAVVNIDLRGTQVMSDRDIDVLMDKINRLFVQNTLPAAGVYIRR